MRWSMIRLIWLRELRDQLRDRRTVFMIVGLPLVLYPALGIVVLTFALQFFENPSKIGVVIDDAGTTFPERGLNYSGGSPAGVASLVAYAGGTSQNVWAGPLLSGYVSKSHFDYPPLVEGTNWCGPAAHVSKREALLLASRFKIVPLKSTDKNALTDRRVDVVLHASKEFYKGLKIEETGLPLVQMETDQEEGIENAVPSRPTIAVKVRADDDHSKQGVQRLRPVLERWKHELKKVRFVRQGIDAEFDNPFEIAEPRTADARDPERLADMVIRIFPFMLVMWSLAGALYPAVDLCAGEKERGTMETLLISPAGREEIVLGKFLTIWMFSAASALLNLLSMGLTTWQFSAMLPRGTFPVGAIFWCIILSLPLSALFSAISLAIGAYARSSKEGQYYLMPMFLVTMPLVFLTMAPGVELNPVYSLIPVTGVALLMQKLMTSPSLATVPWLYFIPVLAPIALYSGLALRWAIDQFKREEVLFREAERIDVRLWLRHLLRDKDATATTGQAFFCFGLLILLKWLSFGVGTGLPPIVHSSISMLAFVATPVLMMTLMLNTEPRKCLVLTWPRRFDLGLAIVLAILIMPPILWASTTLIRDFPSLEKLLEKPRSIENDQRIWRGVADAPWASLLVFALLPAIGEELAFRGFIFTGLRKRYRTRTTVFLTSFMNALFHMNVFAFLPVFVVSTMLGLLTFRSRSLVPAMLFHFMTKTVLLFSESISRSIDAFLGDGWASYGPPFAIACFATAVAICWLLYYRQPLDREEFQAPW